MTDPTALPNFGAPAPASLRERVLAALALAEVPGPGPDGRPAVDEDGDVAVVVGDQQLFVRCVESTPPLLRAFGQWRIDDATGSAVHWLQAANAVTGALNLVKASVHTDRLTVAVDLIAVEGLDLAGLLPATFDAVLGSVRTWHETVGQLLAAESGQQAGQQPGGPDGVPGQGGAPGQEQPPTA